MDVTRHAPPQVIDLGPEIVDDVEMRAPTVATGRTLQRQFDLGLRVGLAEGLRDGLLHRLGQRAGFNLRPRFPGRKQAATQDERAHFSGIARTTGIQEIPAGRKPDSDVMIARYQCERVARAAGCRIGQCVRAVEGELELGAASRAPNECLDARTEQALSEFEQDKVTRADSDIGKILLARSWPGGGEQEQGPIGMVPVAPRIPDVEQFAGRWDVHGYGAF
jgi:hypothetical protein